MGRGAVGRLVGGAAPRASAPVRRAPSSARTAVRSAAKDSRIPRSRTAMSARVGSTASREWSRRRRAETAAGEDPRASAPAAGAILAGIGFVAIDAGRGGQKMAVCTDNITDVTTKDMEAESEDYSNFVKTFVCQSTIIPSDSKSFRTALSSQSVSLADKFLGATLNTVLDGISLKPNIFPAVKKVPDVNFFYKSPSVTSSCKEGRASVISLRCNPTKTGQGDISVPRECPAGTCDGCNFFFLWETAEACPLCTENDYQKIEGACKKGQQETHYVWNEHKFCNKGVSLPNKRLSTCESIDFWLKVGAGVGAFTAVLLIALTCYFWKKNQKLEYKYSKLIMTANSKECELPAADSCAIMEGEDNDDDIVYSNKQSLLEKLKSLATKEKEHSFESVQLKSSRSQNI